MNRQRDEKVNNLTFFNFNLETDNNLITFNNSDICF